MKIAPRYLLAVLTALISTQARADWTLEFVRVACVQEARHVRIDYVGVDGSNALADASSDHAARSKRLRAWARQGFYSPNNLVRTCRLPGATYRIEATQAEAQESGRCAEVPPIYLSLIRNDKPMFSHVFFGDLCGDVTNVKGVDIFDGLQGVGPDVTVCVASKGDDDLKCHLISDTYNNLAVPIDQTGLEKIRDSDL